jgi:hypothetical protein
MKKSEVFRIIVDRHKDANEFIDKIPYSIAAPIFDNEYINEFHKINELLLKEYFGVHADSISWFLYEWKPGYEVSMNDVTTTINSLEEYIDWMIKNEGFE